MAISKGNRSTLDAGEMRARVQIQQNTPTPDGAGGSVDSYATVYSCRGRLLQQSGRRSQEDLELVRNKTFELVIRYTTTFTIDTNTRVVVNDETYLIVNWEKVDGLPHWYRFIISLNA